ncbi:MAG: radical SAM protein [Bdellovibrionaceae bacterium]|nr:radical SAM protein [Pseudobdellovibrionaceae bacterium]
MYLYQDITTLHLEVTSKCNAKCPMCLRNVSGGKTNPLLPLEEISLVQAKEFFPPEFIRGLKRMYMCGNYGDPMVARDTIEIFSYFREINPKIHLAMFTNGSGRNSDWWMRLAQVVDVCHFGIDGIGETHSIYRRKTNFDTVMASAKTFIAAGGKAYWDFIIFKHNQHQLQEAEQLSRDMGFTKITFKKTGRFFSYNSSTAKDSHDVLNDDGSVDYQLFQPDEDSLKNTATQSEAAIVKEFGSFENYLQKTPIRCKVVAEKSIYVSAEGYVWPCCWTGLRMYPWYTKEKGDPIWSLFSSLPEGIEAINLKSKSLESILNGEVFQKIIPDHWKPDKRLKVCAKTCGQKFDSFAQQFV